MKLGLQVAVEKSISKMKSWMVWFHRRKKWLPVGLIVIKESAKKNWNGRFLFPLPVIPIVTEQQLNILIPSPTIFQFNLFSLKSAAPNGVKCVRDYSRTARNSVTSHNEVRNYVIRATECIESHPFDHLFRQRLVNITVVLFDSWSFGLVWKGRRLTDEARTAISPEGRCPIPSTLETDYFRAPYIRAKIGPNLIYWPWYFEKGFRGTFSV